MICGLFKHIMIVGLKSNGRSNESSFQIKINGSISTLQKQSDGHQEEKSFRSNDVWSWLSIVSIFIKRPRPISFLLSVVLCNERSGPWFFIKFFVFKQSFRVPFDFECSWLISTSKDHLKSKFDRGRRKKSHLELEFLSSSTRNEKPCIRRLIGSFRRLIWVRLCDFILIFHHLVLILHFDQSRLSLISF